MADLIRPAAVACWDASVVAQVDAALDAVMAVLEGSGIAREAIIPYVTSLEVHLIVWTDGVTYLASTHARDAWQVYYTILVDDQWTKQGPILHTLVELGEALSSPVWMP